MTAPHPKSLTMALHPVTKGFGWTVFEGPFTPYDWGTKDVRVHKNGTCLALVEALIARYLPHTLVLEAYDPPHGVRSERVLRLCKAIASLAADRGIEVAVYSRKDILACFTHVGARTRQDVAEAVVRHLDAFHRQLPNRRRAWEPENLQMSLFSAAALILTHYQLGATTLFDTL